MRERRGGGVYLEAREDSVEIRAPPGTASVFKFGVHCFDPKVLVGVLGDFAHVVDGGDA